MNDTYILSFKATETPFGFPIIHDPGAVIAKNGKIIAGVEEERLTGIKHAQNIFPVQSISYCLQKAGVDFSDISKIILSGESRAKGSVIEIIPAPESKMRLSCCSTLFIIILFLAFSFIPLSMAALSSAFAFISISSTIFS